MKFHYSNNILTYCISLCVLHCSTFFGQTMELDALVLLVLAPCPRVFIHLLFLQVYSSTASRMIV